MSITHTVKNAPAWVGGRLLLALTLIMGLSGCPTASEQPEPSDAALPTLTDLGVQIATAGLFEDCTPDGTEFSDVRCASGLHCGIVLVGESGAEGSIAQCVPD